MAKNLFCLGDFILSSGASSGFKIDCDALTDDDIETLACLIKGMCEPFHSVEGIPSGGLRLAQALSKYASPHGHKHLFVDDVLTSGDSMRRAKDDYCHAKVTRNTDEVIGAVLFARGQCPYWAWAVFQMPKESWPKLKNR